MKRTMKLTCLIIICAIVCDRAVAQSPSKQVTDNFKKLMWLQGNWTRTNNKVDRTGAERWQKISPVELRGLGFSMKGKDFLNKFYAVM